MFCIFCGRICDFDASQFCCECRERLERNDRAVYILSLLNEAYIEVRSVRLREKIEKVLLK